jgi:hypothetical protein
MIYATTVDQVCDDTEVRELVAVLDTLPALHVVRSETHAQEGAPGQLLAHCARSNTLS